MRVLCCLDGTNVRQISEAAKMLAGGDAVSFGLIFVVDSGPREEIGHLRERFHRRPGPPPARDEEMRRAEKASAEDVLSEGRHRFAGAETLPREGRPEREIVNAAAEWQADLVIICPRAEHGGKPKIGPKSVGHVARFVLDHAPCPVLLVRPSAPGQFPVPR